MLHSCRFLVPALLGLVAGLPLSGCTSTPDVGDGPGVGLEALVTDLARTLAPAMQSGQQPVGFLVQDMKGDATGTALATLFADRLASALHAADPSLTSVVNDADRQLIMAAHRDQLGETFLEQGVPRLGEFMGYRWLITSRLLLRSGGAGGTISVRALDVQTGTVTPTTGLLAMDVDDVLRPMGFSNDERYDAQVCWDVTDPAGGRLDFPDFWSLSVESGMQIRFEVSADRGLHALVLAVGTSGNGLLVFPNGEHPGTTITRQRPVQIPPADLLPFQFDGGPGTETFYVVLSPDPLEEDELFRQLLAAPRLTRRDGNLWIDPQSYVPASSVQAWAAALDGRVTESRRLRGALELIDKIARGDAPDAIQTRDLGNVIPGGLQLATVGSATSARRCAPLSTSGVTVVRFRVPHN